MKRWVSILAVALSIALGVGVLSTFSRPASQRLAESSARALAPKTPLAPSIASPSASSASAAAAPRAVSHCLALGHKGHVTLGEVRDEKVQVRAQGESLYVLGYTHALARTRLLRLSRSGGPIESIASYSGIGEPSRLSVEGGAAWYTRGGVLIKLGPAPGAAVELARGVASPPALAGNSLFVMACDEKGDRVLEIARDGGPSDTLVTIARAAPDRCEYPSLVADEREVFIADWPGSRILAVNRADRSLRVLVSKKGFPSSLVLEPDQLVLLSALGLLRVSRADGAVTRLANDTVALAPYSLLREHGDEYFIYDNMAYSVTNTLYRLPHAGGTPRVLFDHQARDPAGQSFDDNGLRDFDVDDECAYIAQWQFGKPGVQLLAQAQ